MKEKPRLEKDIQREICEWLQANGYFFWRANNIPVFGRNNAGDMVFRSQSKYTMKGIPDILVVHKGIFYGLEVKRVGMKLRPDQKIFGERCTDAGGYYSRVCSVEDVIKIFS